MLHVRVKAIGLLHQIIFYVYYLPNVASKNNFKNYQLLYSKNTTSFIQQAPLI